MQGGVSTSRSSNKAGVITLMERVEIECNKSVT